MPEEFNPTQTEPAVGGVTDSEAAKEAAKTRFQSGKAHAAKAAEDMKAAAEAKARELREAAEVKAHELRSRAETMYGDYRSRARTFKDEGEHYIRENPMRAVLTALGVGFVLGLIFRR